MVGWAGGWFRELASLGDARRLEAGEGVGAAGEGLGHIRDARDDDGPRDCAGGDQRRGGDAASRRRDGCVAA